MIERIAIAFEIDRDRDSTISVPAPEPRPGLDAAFEPSQIAVRLNLASTTQAANLAARRREPDAARELGEGPAPLVARRAPGPTRRPLSYTAISAHGESAEKLSPEPGSAARAEDEGDDDERAASGGAARGRAVHALLEWSQANDWREPDAELVDRVARWADPGADSTLAAEAVLDPFRAWLGSGFFAERIRDAERSRVEVSLLIEVGGTVLRGSIDLLVEAAGKPPLIVNYKTDRTEGATPAELAGRYEVQQAIYALAVTEARGVEEVELAYVFLERPDEPVLARWGPDDLAAARERLETEIARVQATGPA